MTIQLPMPAGDGLSDQAPPPDGRPLLTVSSYADAVAAVDALAEAHFPVEHVEIVGRGVRTVESVTGRYGTGRAVLSGAFGGAFAGAVVALIFGRADAGREFSSYSTLTAEHYDVSYDVTLTGGQRAEALRALHEAGIA